MSRVPWAFPCISCLREARPIVAPIRFMKVIIILPTQAHSTQDTLLTSHVARTRVRSKIKTQQRLTCLDAHTKPHTPSQDQPQDITGRDVTRTERAAIVAHIANSKKATKPTKYDTDATPTQHDHVTYLLHDSVERCLPCQSRSRFSVRQVGVLRSLPRPIKK